MFGILHFRAGSFASESVWQSFGVGRCLLDALCLVHYSKAKKTQLLKSLEQNITLKTLNWRKVVPEINQFKAFCRSWTLMGIVFFVLHLKWDSCAHSCTAFLIDKSSVASFRYYVCITILNHIHEHIEYFLECEII